MDYEIVRRTINDGVEMADVDVSTETGTITGLITSAAAVPITGLYGYADAVGLKPFADMCSPQDLVRHAKIKGVTVPAGIDDDELRRRVLTAYRIPPSGADLFSWTNEIAAAAASQTGVKFALFENDEARGMGSADIVLSFNASQETLSRVRSFVNDFRPYGLADLQVSRATRRNVELRVLIRGRSVSFAALRDAILDNFGEGASGSIGADIGETSIYAIASNFGVLTARTFWRNTGEGDWTQGTVEVQKTFVNGASVYEQLVVTDVDIADL